MNKRKEYNVKMVNSKTFEVILNFSNQYEAINYIWENKHINGCKQKNKSGVGHEIKLCAAKNHFFKDKPKYTYLGYIWISDNNITYKRAKNPNYGCIYKIINKITKQCCYIGQTTKTINERFNIHKSKFLSTDNKEKHTWKLYEIFDKYGLDNFYIEMLEDNILIDQLDNREKYWIDKYKPEGNIRKGGGQRIPKDVISKFELLIQTDKNVFENGFTYIAKLINSNRDTVKKLYTIYNIAFPTFDQYERKKNKNKCKVLAINKKTKEEVIYNDQYEAAEFIKNLNMTTLQLSSIVVQINRCIRGKIKSIYGYTWSKVEE